MDTRQHSMMLRTAFDQRFSAMDTERLSFLPTWQESADFISPRSLLIGSVTQASKGSRINQRILDPTATLALRTLESGLMAGLTSPSRPWFKLGTPDGDLNKWAAAKQWFSDVEKIMRQKFALSNLYQILPMLYSDLGLYATGGMSVQEDHRHTFRFYPFQIGTYLIAVNDRMRVDTVYREIPMTVQQVVQRFGLENCSDTVKSFWKNNQAQTTVIIRHVIEPNDDRGPAMVDAKNKPFRSVYYESGNTDTKLLSQSGFDEFPGMFPRWRIYNATDAYGGDCPALTAIGLIKGLQREHKSKYKALDKYVDPPMVADSSLQSQMINLTPNGITYVNGLATSQHAGLRRLEQDLPDISHLTADIEDVRNLINRCFYVDMMQMLAQSDNPEMTAREIEERHAEKVLVLGPLMERLNDELFDPLIDRCFNILLRRGMIPPPPQEVQGQEIKVEYTSIMAQAQKLMGLGNDDKLLEGIGRAAQINPQALDKIDVDAWVDGYADKLGTDPRMVRSADQVQGLRQKRQQQEAMQQMAAAAQPMERMAKAGKAMGETDPEQVQRMVGMMTGAA